jgi:hypothetical protein
LGSSVHGRGLGGFQVGSEALALRNGEERSTADRGPRAVGALTEIEINADPPWAGNVVVVTPVMIWRPITWPTKTTALTSAVTVGDVRRQGPEIR